jgi:hypothetical protein
MIKIIIKRYDFHAPDNTDSYQESGVCTFNKK